MNYEGYYLAFFAFIGIILIVIYYNIQQQQELSAKLINNVNTMKTANRIRCIHNVNNIKKDNIDDDHNKIYKEYTSYKTTKDINNYTYNIDNIDFNKDIVVDNNKLGNPYQNNYDKGLEEIYTQKLKGNDMNENDEIFDYSIKPNKTDLPIVNPPLQLLKANAPLRLSERHFF